MKFLQLLLLSTITTIVMADTTLTFTDKKDNETLKMMFANNMLRSSTIGQNDSYAIYDGKNTTFTVITTKEKQYFVMDKETLESLGDMQTMIDKILDKQLADMPEAQREMMRGMMAGALKTQMSKQMEEPVYEFTGKKKSYNGFDCEVVVKKSKKKKSEFCVTAYDKVGMKDSEFAVIKSFQKIMQKLTRQFNQDSSMDFSMLGDYIPVRYNQMGDSGELSNVNHDAINANFFSIPQDYKRIDMPF